MTQFPVSSSSEQSIYAALELSKNSWLLAIQVPGRDNPSLYPIRGGNAEGLIAKLDAARQRLAKASGQVPKLTLCTEAGYDGFWLARFLEPRGVDCRVMDPASLRVKRRARRVTTDRIDVEKLPHTLIAWCRGERHVRSMVVIPSVEEEDIRRSHRERGRLVRERTAHINRIKGAALCSGHSRDQRHEGRQNPGAGGAGHGRRPALARTSRPGDHAGDRETGPGASADR